ncbi:MAG: nicotinate-nucleotide--dimethylbenzimidazole phosphoribosyltransferase [Candidatus Omnitrophota bacterium]
MTKIEEVLKNIESIDRAILEKTQQRLDNLTKPRGSLGRLEELAKQVVAITAKDNPSLSNKVIFTFAADHGVVDEGVSAYPKEVTAQMVYNFIRGGAGINVLAKHIGARVVVADVGVSVDLEESPGLVIKKINYGTKNMVKGPAMDRNEAIRSIEVGIEIFAKEYNNGIEIIGTGEMGIGNTTPSSAITATFTGEEIKNVTGRGTGIDDAALENKVRVIQDAISVNKPDPSDPIDVLSKVGGYEIGALCGLILAAASKRVPVVIDGFISATAALLAYKIEPKVKDYLIAGHCSVEQGHKVILRHIGLKPVLDMDLRLGEGTGAALAIGIVEAGIKILTEMATFASAGISEEK